jgi:type II secretory pathway component GspD/PulD (secretin)
MYRFVLVILAITLAPVRPDAQAAAPAGPLDSRVTIDYRAAPAADVIRTLASAAGLQVEIAPGTLRPVTITLTNVKLRTALDAVCDNALCSWLLMAGSPLKVTPLPSEGSVSLPSRVSFSVDNTAPSDVFRALAAAIDVPLTVEPSLPSEQISINFRDAATAEVLNLLCNMLQCTWDFDPVRGLRITQKR